MKLKHAQQITFSALKECNYDLLIAASGYETRSTTLSSNIHDRANSKVVIGFTAHKDHPQRLKNDKIFKDLGFSEYLANEGSCDEIISILDELLNANLFKSKLTVVVDYSCMTKVWYATFVNYFLNKYSEIENLELIFCYSPSKFSKPQKPMPNKYMGPIPGIYRVSASYKPTALILGLGYEKETAKGIVEYLDPKITYAFYSKPSFDEKFTKIVEANNLKLIDALGKEYVYTHPIADLKTTDALLSSLCLSLKNKYRIILAPLGPKPFALMCLLISIKYPDIDIWRVSSGDSGNIYDRLPAKENPIICQVVFENQSAIQTKKEIHLAS